MAKKKTYIVPTGTGFGGGGFTVVTCDPKDAPEGAREAGAQPEGQEPAEQDTED